MSQRSIGFVLIGVGVLVLVVSGFADALGIGGVPGFGWKQILGSVAGLLVAVVGVWLANRKAA